MNKNNTVSIESVINEVPWRFMPIWGVNLRVGINLETNEVAFCVRTLEQTMWFDTLAEALKEFNRLYED